MNEDTLLDSQFDDLTFLREMATKARKVEPKAAQPPQSPTVAKLLKNFRKKLEDEIGCCFRTEIRDSGIFICGIHQSAIWSEELDTCPQLSVILKAFESAVATEIQLLEGLIGSQQNESAQKRWPQPDGTKASWGDDPNVTRFDFWSDLEVSTADE